jgi:NitT/TauT family transport system ATP-binding protein
MHRQEQRASEPRLLVNGITKGYGQGPILENLSFSLRDGDTLAVIGPSGCGKSTLLYLLAGLDKPQNGQVGMRGPDGGKPRIAFILQDYGLFPWKTVWENVVLPLELARVPKSEQKENVASLLEELGIGGLNKRYPDQLSGGQRQRVAVARALITAPDILLMDEPFSSLDAITREQMQNLILHLWERRRLTTVLVTHSVSEAAFLGRYVMVLGGRPARSTLWLENPWFGDPDCRSKEGFFEITRQIYGALSRNGDETALECAANGT